tara:strand:+ start:19759 stop:20190 length:432 start_codon:yes stop_codon:yes gene_type:complete
MSFTTELKTFTEKEAKPYFDRVVRGVIIEIGTRLVYRSPVGDPSTWQSPPPEGYVGGAFRVNWQYEFGKEADGTLAEIEANPTVAISRITNKVLGAQVNGIHYIVNNMPYAQRLEDGWSGQAPQGMVGLVELEFEQIVRGIAA